MKYNFRKILKNNKGVLANFSYLSLLQGFNLIIPLITYPYLVRILGTDNYGLVIFAQTIASYFSLIINFGFDISGAREIAVNKDDKDSVSEIVSSIFIIKTVIWLTLLLFLIVFLFYFNSLEWNTRILVFFSFTICFNELLFPQWYFQGMEKLKFVTFTSLLTKSFFVLLIFVFVKKQSDFILVPLISGVGAFIGGLIGIYFLFVNEGIRLKWVKLFTLKKYLVESATFFGSQLVISFKDRLNVIFIGHFFGMHEVAIYDLGLKFMNLLMKPIDIVNAAIYPKMARSLDINYLIKIIKISLFAILLLIIVINVFLNNIIIFFLGSIDNNILTIRILLLCSVIFSISLPLARNCLTVFNKYKLLFIGMVYTTIFYLILIAIGFKLNLFTSINVFALITLMVYLFELGYRFYICKSENII